MSKILLYILFVCLIPLAGATLEVSPNVLFETSTASFYFNESVTFTEISFSDPNLILNPILTPSTNYNVMVNNASIGTALSDGTGVISQQSISYISSDDILIYFLPTKPTGAIGAYSGYYWNSYTQNNKKYIPVPSGQPVIFRLLPTNSSAAAVWTLNGVLTGETTLNYSHIFNTPYTTHYVHGVAEGLDITWILPVLSYKAVVPVPTIANEKYNNLSNAFNLHDPVTFIENIASGYTDTMGNMFYVLIWGAVFGAFWLHKGSITIPSTLGLILGAAIIGTLPADYQGIAQFMIGAGICIIIILMFKERK